MLCFFSSEDTELNFLTMSVYNNEPFQSNLVKHISKSIEQLFPNQWSNSVTSFNTQEENCEITKLKLKSKQLVKLTNIFEVSVVSACVLKYYKTGFFRITLIPRK